MKAIPVMNTKAYMGGMSPAHEHLSMMKRSLLFAAMSLLLMASAGWAQIAIDVAIDKGGFSNVNTSSLSCTAGSPNYALLLIGAHSTWPIASDVELTATYGGNAMTLIGKLEYMANEGTRAFAAIFGLASPPSGTQTAAWAIVNGNAYGDFGCITLTGVDTGDPFGTALTANANTGTTHTHTISSESGDLVVDAIHRYQEAGGEGDFTGNGTTRFKESGFSSTFYIGAGQTRPGDTSVDMTWTGTSNTGYGHVAVNINGTGAAPPGGKRMMMMGVGD